MAIKDAPWIREAEETGHSSYGWWNNPPKERCADNDILFDYEKDDDYDDDFEGSDGDVFYGNETSGF